MKSKAFKTITGLLMALTLLTGCAISPKTQVVQPGDHEMTRTQIQAEFKKLDQAQRDVDSNKGVNGTNIAAALFFWPGLIATQMDASDAQNLINQRRAHLQSIWNKKFS